MNFPIERRARGTNRFIIRLHGLRLISNDRVLACENVDLAKWKGAMDTAEIKALMAKHTVIDPVEVYLEVDGGIKSGACAC